MFAGVAALWLACGGKAVVDGGSGGSSSKSSSRSSGTGQGATGPAPVSASTGPAPSICSQACNDLFDCGLQAGNCPGFTEGQRLPFLNGDNGDGCISSCEANPAFPAIVDPTDCPGTIDTFKAVNPTFACICDQGVGHPDCL